ncbi:hypothetical protein HZC34_01600 [Candidatus Saganbacteria bacterium]|nr:hypothetical protein [Candidatus Saganbacteria bacterium]
MIRYADDFVICLQHKEEAQKVMGDLKGRLGKFGLETAEDKTRADMELDIILGIRGQASFAATEINLCCI